MGTRTVYIEKVVEKKLPELTLEEKKKLITEQINLNKNGIFGSESDFRREIEKTLTDDEKKFIRGSDINQFYLDTISKAYKEIIKGEEDEMKNKLVKQINLNKNGKYESESDFRCEVEKTLTDDEKKFIRGSDINQFYLDTISKAYQEIIKGEEDKKKTKLAEQINSIKEGNFASETNFRLEFEKTLTDDMKKFIRSTNIESFYLDTISKAYKVIKQKRIEEEKENFKNNIYSKINLVYSSLCSDKKKFDEKIKKTLTYNENQFLTKGSSLFDETILNFYNAQLDAYWADIDTKKNEDLRIIEIKKNLKNKIREIYKSGEYKKMEDLDNKIRESYDVDLIDKIFDYYNGILKQFWNDTKEEDIQSERNKTQKKNDFKDNIKNIIANAYLENKDSIKKLDDLKNLINLDEEQKSFLNDDTNINSYYNAQLNEYYNQVKEEKKKELKDKIENIIYNVYSKNKDEINSEENLNEKVKSSLDEFQNQLLEDIQDDFDRKLGEFYEKIKNKKNQSKANFISNLNNKISEVYSINEEEDPNKLKDLIKNSLIDEEEKKFIKEKEIDDLLLNKVESFLKLENKKRKEMQDEKNSIIDKKKTEFKNKINEKILNAFSTCEDVENETKLDELVKNLFDKEEKEFMKEKEVSDLYQQNLNMFWNSVEKKRKQKQDEEMKNLKNKKKKFKLDIDDLILKIYTINSEVKTKDELDSKIKEILEEEEKGFLGEIEEYYSQRLTNFWDKKIKDRIFERINDAYEISKYIDKKEDFESSIEQNLKLTPEEENILKNTKIFDEYKKKLDLLWKNSEKERGFNILISQQSERLKELEKANKEKEDEFKKEQNKLQQLIEQQNSDLQQLKSDSEQKQKQFDEERERILNDTKNQIKEAEERMKNEKDEEAKKREQEKIEQQQKIEKINKDFYDKVEKMKSEKIKTIKEEIKKIENEFCMEEIQKIDKEIITELIDKVFERDQIIDFVLDKLNNDINNNKDKIKNAKHLNIILVGPSGVGKSTLINAVLENEEETETGFGQTKTKGIKYHESPKIDFLRLADSQGIEKNEKFGISETCKNTKKFIDEQLKEDPDKYIHCIWYCWKGTRLEESEVNVLEELSKQYTLDSLPVIIVYTNAIIKTERESAEKYVKDPKDKGGLNLDNIFIPVLSKEIEVGNQIIPPFGIDILIEKSIELAKKAVKSSLYEGLKKEIKESINNEINMLTSQIKGRIDNEVNTIKSNMNQDSSLEDIYKDTFKIILDVYYKYIFLNSQKCIQNYDNPIINLGNNQTFSITNDSKNEINKFVVNYYTKVMGIKATNAEKLLDSYAEKLTDEIIIYQLNYNNDNEHLLQCSWSKEDLKVMIRNDISQNISKQLEIMALRNSFSFLIEPLLNLFGEYFIGSYQLGMKEESFEKHALEVISISFADLEKKIKEYSESKRKVNNECSNNQEAPATPSPPPSIAHIKNLFKKKKAINQK